MSASRNERKIQLLDAKTAAMLRSGVAITSLAQCVEELVLNSIDAHASAIDVHIDTGKAKVRVIDNGCGIAWRDLQLVGKRHATSKCASVLELQTGVAHHGYRGEAIASIKEMALVVEIVSRSSADPSKETYYKLLHPSPPVSAPDASVNGAPVLQPESESVGVSSVKRSTSGTIVTVHGLFAPMPVRQKTLSHAAPLELERTRRAVEAIALAHPSVAFILHDDQAARRILATRRANSALGAFKQLFGGSSQTGPTVDVEMTLTCEYLAATAPGDERDIPAAQKPVDYILRGFLCTQPFPSAKKLQFFYVNKRRVLHTRLHKEVGALLKARLLSSTASGAPSTAGASMGSKATPDRLDCAYVLNLSCPPALFDVTFEPSKTMIEFADWETPLELVRRAVKRALCIPEPSEAAAHTATDSGSGASSSRMTRLVDLFQRSSGRSPVLPASARDVYSTSSPFFNKSQASSLVKRSPGGPFVAYHQTPGKSARLFSQTEGDGDEESGHATDPRKRTRLEGCAPDHHSDSDVLSEADDDVSDAEDELQAALGRTASLPAPPAAAEIDWGREEMRQLQDFDFSTQLNMRMSSSVTPVSSILSLERSSSTASNQTVCAGRQSSASAGAGADEFEGPALALTLSEESPALMQVLMPALSKTRSSCAAGGTELDDTHDADGADDADDDFAPAASQEQQERQQPKSFRELVAEWRNPVYPSRSSKPLDARAHSSQLLRFQRRNEANRFQFRKELFTSLRVLAQVDQKFVLCLAPTIVDSGEENAGDSSGPLFNLLVFVDQHAAHERIRLERFCNEIQQSSDDRRSSSTTVASNNGSGSALSIQLSELKAERLPEPMSIALSAGEVRLLNSFSPFFTTRLGIAFTSPSSEQLRGLADQALCNVLVESVPTILLEASRASYVSGQFSTASAIDADIREKIRRQRQSGDGQQASERAAVAILARQEMLLRLLLKALIQTSLEQQSSTAGGACVLPQTIQSILASKACHGAIKFGDALSMAQCESLVSTLASCNLPFQCAHGRPSLSPLIELSELSQTYPAIVSYVGDSRPGGDARARWRRLGQLRTEPVNDAWWSA